MWIFTINLMGDDGIKNNVTIFTCRIKIIRPNHNCSKKCMIHLNKFYLKMFWLKFFHRFWLCDLSLCWFWRRLLTSSRSLSRAVGSVVHGHPCQPATSAGVKYLSMASCAGASHRMQNTLCVYIYIYIYLY